MTATAELVAIARTMPQPVDPYLGPCRAYVGEVAGAWRIVWALDGGRRQQPAGPAFPLDRAGGRDARHLSRILNGGPASRSSLDSDFAHGAGTAVARRDEGGATSEAPESPVGPSAGGRGHVDAYTPDPVAVPNPAAGVRTCAVCGQQLPPRSRSHRRTDSEACRRALARREANEGRADAQGADTGVPLSERSEGPVPTSSAAPGVDALSGSAEDAGPLDSPGPPGLDVPTLGIS